MCYTKKDILTNAQRFNYLENEAKIGKLFEKIGCRQRALDGPRMV